MSKKKGIAVAVVLLLVLIIGGMLAYFTDTDTKQNVFTIGDEVEIAVVENAWVPSKGQGGHPGTVIPKDPTIHNESTTTPAYVFMKVTVPCYKKGSSTSVDTELFSYTLNSGWTKISESEINQTSKTKTYVYAYGTSTAMTTLAKNATTPALFNNVKMDETLTAAQAATAPATPNIDIKGYGIQVDGLGDNDTPQEIFALFGNV